MEVRFVDRKVRVATIRVDMLMVHRVLANNLKAHQSHTRRQK